MTLIFCGALRLGFKAQIIQKLDGGGNVAVLYGNGALIQIDGAFEPFAVKGLLDALYAVGAVHIGYGQSDHNFFLLKRSALSTTQMELRDIQNPAIMGFSRIPKKG